MIARLTRSNLCWLLLTLGVSFAVAACAASGGQPDRPGTTRPPPRTGGGSESQATPPDQGTQAPRAGRERTPLGDTAEIRRPWAQVRSAPNENARAIALVFGNDELTVVEKQGDWMRVRLSGRREGWIHVSATERP